MSLATRFLSKYIRFIVNLSHIPWEKYLEVQIRIIKRNMVIGVKKKQHTIKNSWDMVILRLYSSLTTIFTLMESFSYIFGRPHLWVWSLMFMKYKHSYIAAKSPQWRPTLCNPTDGSSPGSTVPEILQARTLEWVAISFSNALKWKAQSCPTLSDPIDCSLPGSSVHGIFQARVLEWSAIAFSVAMYTCNQISM